MLPADETPNDQMTNHPPNTALEPMPDGAFSSAFAGDASCSAVAQLFSLGIIRMSTSVDTALDNLTRIVQVVRRDRKLRRWFDSLSQKSALERRNAIFAMSEQMLAESEDADLVAAFHLLADARVFEAACEALAD